MNSRSTLVKLHIKTIIIIYYGTCNTITIINNIDCNLEHSKSDNNDIYLQEPITY